ncbi:MAG: hypothetical protein ABL871_13700 [Terricaulis sp.]
MRVFLASVAIVLAGVAACAPAPAGSTAATAETVTQEAPAVMAPPQIALPVSIVGRWGATAEDCAPMNAAMDGVLEIGATSVDMGRDACTIKSSEPEGLGAHLVVQCTSGEGGASYERDFSFVSSSADTLTWITEGGEHHAYVRCR